MADELIFVIDGAEYPCPDIASFNMGERRVMFDLSGIVEEDFAQGDDETDEEKEARVGKLTRHPGFIESLMHIAYARGNPELKRPRVQDVIDNTNYLEAIEKWADREGDDANPVSEPTNKPSDPSLSSVGSKTTTTGLGLPNGLGLQDETPSRIGALR